MTQKFTYPSMLSFKASISPSPFMFYNMNGNLNDVHKESLSSLTRNLSPVKVINTGLRTTIANYSTTEKIKTALIEKGGANVKIVEKAFLNPDSNILVIKGSVKLFKNFLNPEGCNEESFLNIYQEYVSKYKNKIGFDQLIERYVMNLINGSILWRNKYADFITKIQIKKENLEISISSEDFINENILSIQSLNNNAKKHVTELIDKISSFFKKDTDFILLDVVCFVDVGNGQVVYPSQEFMENSDKKTLAKFTVKTDNGNVEQAYFHEQKIGNAIRTIDTWYKDDNDLNPIAIEPYGVSQKESTAYRINNNSFYDYFQKIDTLSRELDTDNIDKNKHMFVMGCLLRGGVFSGAKKSNKTNGDE